MCQIPLSVENSIKRLAVDDQTVITTTNAPTVSWAAILICSVLEGAKRKLTSKDLEFDCRRKRPQYMHFIFGKNDVGHTPSTTYTESSPPIPPVPTSDY